MSEPAGRSETVADPPQTQAVVSKSGEPRPTRAIEGLTCPSCGGALAAHEGLRVLQCPFCGTPELVLAERGLLRLAVEPEIEAAAAQKVVRHWLGSGLNKHRKLRTEARIGEAFLCMLPFFRVRADVVGAALGTERRKRNKRTYDVDVERRVAKSFDRTYPALNVSEWGIQKVDLRGDRLVSWDPERFQRMGMVFAPTGSERDVKDGALASFVAEADPANGLHKVRFHFVKTIRERVTIVYYPLWVVRYSFRGRSYQVLVDAQDGSVAFGKAPGNDLYRAAMLVATEAVALFIATTVWQLAEQHSTGGITFLGLFCLAVVAFGWRRFRYGGVVIEGTGVQGNDNFQNLVRQLRAGKTDGMLGAVIKDTPLEKYVK